MSGFSTNRLNLSAEASARVTVEARKRAAEKGYALPDGSWPVQDLADLRRALQSYNKAKDKMTVRLHLTRRAKELNATHILPKTWQEFTNTPPQPRLTSAIVSSIQDLSADIPLPLLTTIYLRGVRITNSHDLALQRLHDFLTPDQAHCEDADLVLIAGGLVAAPFGSGDNYEEHEHPRGRDGKWIKKFGRVKLHLNFGAPLVPGTVQHSDVLDPDHIQVRLDNGTTVTVRADQIEASKARALLPNGDLDPDFDPDDVEIDTNAEEQARLDAQAEEISARHQPGDILDVPQEDGTPYAIVQVQKANPDGTYVATVTDYYDEAEGKEKVYQLGQPYTFRPDQLREEAPEDSFYEDAYNTPLSIGDHVKDNITGVIGVFEGEKDGKWQIGVIHDPLKVTVPGELYTTTPDRVEKLFDPTLNPAPEDRYRDRPEHFPAHLLNGNTAIILAQGTTEFKILPTHPNSKGINTSGFLENDQQTRYFVKNSDFTGTAGADVEVDVSRLYRSLGLNAPYVESGGHDGQLIIGEVAGREQGLTNLGTLMEVFETPYFSKGDRPPPLNLEELNLADPASIFQLGISNLVASQADRHSGNIMMGRDGDGKGYLIPIDNEYGFGVGTLAGPMDINENMKTLEFAYDAPLGQYTAQAPKEQRLQEISAHLDDIQASINSFQWQSQANRQAALDQLAAMRVNPEAVYARLLGTATPVFDISDEEGSLDDFRSTKEDLQPGDVIYGPNGERLTIVGINSDGTIIARDPSGDLHAYSPESITLEEPALA